ncbi:YbaB/EbfC family nucleoid-associated protein [Streptomyces sp. NPDC002520]
MSGYEQEIERLLADYRTQRGRIDENRRRINAMSATVTAPRKVVSVTVTARGEVTEIDFPTGAFRRMTPKELGEILRTAIADARAQALEQVDELVFGDLPFQLKPSAVLTGSADLGELLPAEPEPADEVREYLNNGVPDRGGDRRD